MTAPATSRDTTVPAGPERSLAGVGSMIRLILRRDRVRLPVWIGSLTLFTVWFASALPTLYADAAERQVRAELFTNPGLRSFVGPGYGLDDYTFGAMLANEMLGMTSIAVALMGILLMVRHTRAEEESGQAELVRSMVVGRHATTTAALTVVTGASLVMGLATAIGLGSLGLESVTWADSLLFGTSLASVGVVFAAVAAVTAQVSRFARGAAGLAGALYAVTYFLRGAGDMSAIGGGALSWASPIGWAQQTRSFVDGRWWPLLLSLTLTALVVPLAYHLSARRDVGGSLVEPRPGRATGSRLLGSPMGLAWRLQRTWLAWWGLAIAVFGVGYGAVTGEVERFAEDIDIMDDYLAGIGGDTVIDSWLALLMMMVALTVALFAVASALRMRGEESSGRAEPMLATATSRRSWMASHLGVAIVGSSVLMVLAAAGMASTAGSALDRPGTMGDLLGASLVWLPAIWVTVGFGVALFGLAPRATVAAWIAIAYALVVGMVGPLLGLPDWALDLSPFGHTPMLPAAPMQWTPLVILTALAAGLIALGVVGFRRRDLQSPA